MKIGVVGAGFSGAVIARELAKAGHKIDVFESRDHVAGNCHTLRDPDSNIMKHIYGPHIFHTSNENVWNYIRQFDEIMPFVNRVKSIYKGRVYSLPINLMTINSFFDRCFNPKEAEEFIKSQADQSIQNPQTFEEQALRFVGKDIYEAFFKNYTEKQWGLKPSELPASILKRLPVRFNYDDNYYASKYQGIPKNGYSYIVEKILDHENINILMKTHFAPEQARDYAHIFYSGPIDAWFGYSDGRLSYRTLDFVQERHKGDYQGNAVINYSDKDVPWTRISEHKHFTPWEEHIDTIIYKEYSRACGDKDIPYYPIRLVNDKSSLSNYIDRAKKEKNITFVGRLGTYRYLDMHITIEEALLTAKKYLQSAQNKEAMPSFVVDPL